VDDLDRIARAHMAQQVREVAETQATLARLWDLTLDPSDIDGSFQVFQSRASALIKGSRSRGELTAQQYYQAQKVLAGFATPAPMVDLQPEGARANRNALHATSVAKAKAAIARGEAPEVALQAAKAAMLRSAKRRILEAPRKRLIALSAEDDDAVGWARVSDASPCYFCAMLVSRGPVYTGVTAKFRAHDGCGCSARPVMRGDSAGGWSEDARALRKLWDDPGEYGGEPGSGFDWRSAYARARADPKSALNTATANTLALAA
jgi:hypothetical protein